MSAISLIIPCYNEEKRLDVSTFLAFGQAQKNVSMCFVNDGSKDKTLDILQALRDQATFPLEVLNLSENKGKAEAVRQGILHMHALPSFSGDYFGYIDADLATPLDQLQVLIGYSLQPNTN